MHERAEPLQSPLVSLDQERDREFETHLVETSTLAFRVAFSVLRQQEDAEDVAQEAFTRAYRHFWRLRDRSRFRSWLVRTTWRAALDRQRSNRRRQGREVAVEGAVLSEAPDLSQVSERDRDRTSELWRAIDALPEKLRVAIVLASIEGHEVRDVAALLGVPEGTVKSRLFLARQRLRESLR
jgi:RNA polymerase sigma-70 factor (ECF subfamily)